MTKKNDGLDMVIEDKDVHFWKKVINTNLTRKEEMEGTLKLVNAVLMMAKVKLMEAEKKAK